MGSEDRLLLSVEETDVMMQSRNTDDDLIIGSNPNLAIDVSIAANNKLSGQVLQEAGSQMTGVKSAGSQDTKTKNDAMQNKEVVETGIQEQAMAHSRTVSDVDNKGNKLKDTVIQDEFMDRGEDPSNSLFQAHHPYGQSHPDSRKNEKAGDELDQDDDEYSVERIYSGAGSLQESRSRGFNDPVTKTRHTGRPYPSMPTDAHPRQPNTVQDADDVSVLSDDIEDNDDREYLGFDDEYYDEYDDDDDDDDDDEYRKRPDGSSSDSSRLARGGEEDTSHMYSEADMETDYNTIDKSEEVNFCYMLDEYDQPTT